VASISKQIPRIWLLAILVISLMLVVVACGSSDEPPPTLAPGLRMRQIGKSLLTILPPEKLTAKQQSARTA